MTAGGSQLPGCRALRLPALSLYSSISNPELWGRCGGGGDLRDVKTLRNSLLFRTPRIWACASLVGGTYTTITRGGHTTPTHPKPKESIGFWALAGRRGLSGKAAGSRKSPPPWHPTPCSAARGSRYNKESEETGADRRGRYKRTGGPWLGERDH